MDFCSDMTNEVTDHLNGMPSDVKRNKPNWLNLQRLLQIRHGHGHEEGDEEHWHDHLMDGLHQLLGLDHDEPHLSLA